MTRISSKAKFSTLLKAGLLSLTLNLFLGGCALNKDAGGSTDQDRTVSDRSQKLRNEYTEVVGQYEGTLSTNSGIFETSVSLYTVEVDDGMDSSGRTRTKPSLKASLTLNDSVDDYAELIVSFDRDSGQFTMAADKGSAAAPNKKSVSAKGLVVSRILTGELTKEGGPWGTLNLKLKNEKATSISDQEQRDRIIRNYSKIAGSYKVTIAANGSTETEIVSIKISSATNPPTLTSECRGPWGIEVMNAAFDPLSKPASVYISSNPNGTSGAKCLFTNFIGSPTAEGLVGTIDVRQGGSMPAVFKRMMPK